MPVSQGAREELKDEASVRAGRHAVEQRCISASCGAAYPITDTRSECGVCGNLLDVRYDWPLLSASELGAAELKRLWLERKASREPRDLSGVWRFRELI